MFNDLGTPNASGRPVVDDIFAETDKPSAGAAQPEIETHRVGLATMGESLPPSTAEMPQIGGGKSNVLKIIIIVLVALIVLGGGYFAYSQFMQKKTDTAIYQAPATKTVKMNTNTNTNNVSNTQKASDTVFVTSIPGTTSTPAAVIPISSGTVSDLASSSDLTAIATGTPEATIDSDNDGLPDAEEKKLGTNPNVVDTDHDGLSDYEEVMVYHTNPLNPDTDGDGYLDGAEVKNGYDPNVKGAKLPGTSVKK